MLLAESKAILKSVSVSGGDPGDGYEDAELEKKTRAVMLERSRERRRRMSETFDVCPSPPLFLRPLPYIYIYIAYARADI